MFHLCRTFEDPEITHVEGEVDPVRDLDIINEELRYPINLGYVWVRKVSMYYL